MILVDTSVWIDYFSGAENRPADQLDHALAAETVLIGDLILLEILQGFDRERDFQSAKDALDPLDCVHLGTKNLAVKAAAHFRHLRSEGITIRKTVDMLIAAWCMNHDIALLHNDKDFARIASKLPLYIYNG